jgi:hypothetical protein
LAARAPERRHGARLLAGDPAGGILVFEDIGTGLGSLVEPLLEGQAEAAERALIAYAVALGRLHADTVACADEHARALRAGFPTVRLPAARYRARLERVAAGIRERIGGRPPDEELAQMAHRLQEPGAWLTLVHGDPCPDNALMAPDGVRLIDFEFAAPGMPCRMPSIGGSGFRPAGAPDACRMRSRRGSRPRIGPKWAASSRKRATRRRFGGTAPSLPPPGC